MGLSISTTQPEATQLAVQSAAQYGALASSLEAAGVTLESLVDPGTVPSPTASPAPASSSGSTTDSPAGSDNSGGVSTASASDPYESLDEASGGTGGPTIGAIVGGAVGGLVFVACLAVFTFFLVRAASWSPVLELIIALTAKGLGHACLGRKGALAVPGRLPTAGTPAYCLGDQGKSMPLAVVDPLCTR